MSTKFAVPFLVLGLAVFGCSSSDSPNPGTGGSTGTGRGGTTGGARGGSGISSSVHRQPSRFRNRSVRPSAALGWNARDGAFVSFAIRPLSRSQS